jgi:predicted transposase/invertase (TIGR01784 family)
MLFKELTREEDLEISRLDGYEEGERAGFSKGERAGFTKGERAGAEQKQCEIAKSFKKSGIPIDVIAKNTGLSEKEIAEL